MKLNIYLPVRLYPTMQLDDTIIKTIETAPDPELKEAKDLIRRIRRRDLYQVFHLLDSQLAKDKKAEEDFFCLMSE